ncbi:MAG: hypothetical protein KF901_18370 [Myxococcales bacterium]|nr:hypothetical protein [Myxococcales bacterium]
MYTGALLDLVPSDATEVLELAPASLTAPATAPLLEVLAPEAWRRAFANRTGVDPTEVPEAVVARWRDDGSWWALARTRDAPAVVRAAGARMVPVEAESDEPLVRRIGYLGADRRELVAIGDDIVLVAAGRAGAVAALLGRLREGPPPRFGDDDVAALRRATQGAAIVLHVPRPLDLPLDTPTGLLLARERALAFALAPTSAETLAAQLVLRAELPPGADENLRQLVRSLGASPLGHALGLDRAMPTLVVEVEPEGASLAAEWPSDALARGLHLLFRAEIAEIIGGL